MWGGFQIAAWAYERGFGWLVLPISILLLYWVFIICISLEPTKEKKSMPKKNHLAIIGKGIHADGGDRRYEFR